MAELARILDPSELDAVDGPHGKMSLVLSASELGAPIAVVVPSRLVCGRCDGGGCDGCGRSGAVRLELDEEQRTTHVALPKDARDVRVRLVRPLGDDAGLAQLTLEVRVKPETALARRRSEAMIARSPTSAPGRSVLVALALALAALAALAASLR